MDQRRWQHTSSSFALPKPPTPPSLADPPRVRNLLTRMSSVIGWPSLLTAIWVFAPCCLMVTSIRLEPQSMEFWQISRTQPHRQSA